MDPQTRITQFKSLIDSDPNNDMAHFSLANAYLQANQLKEAAASFIRCTEINKGMTKAFQLAGRALIDINQNEQATEILTWGYIESVTRGDMLPKKAIEEMLKEINAPIPEVVQKGKQSDSTSSNFEGGNFRCTKTGQMGHKLPRPPFKNAIGQWIQDNISKETFNEWIGMGTKIINELRLDLSRDDHDAAYDYAMRLYLGLTDDLYTSVMNTPPPMPESQFKGVIEDIMAMGGHLESEQGNLHTKVD